MSTIYRDFHVGENNDGFSTVLKEAAEYFQQSHRMNIIGEGFKDVLTETVAFNEYVDKLTEGLDATESENLRELLNNARQSILKESAIGGIQPIASLTMPVLRKMWAKIALKYAIPTEPVKTPAFSVAHTNPYILKADGTKVTLPNAIKDASGLGHVSNTPVDPAFVGEANGTAQELLPAGVGSLDPIHHKLDKSVEIATIILDGGAFSDQVVPVNLKADLYGRVYGEFIVKDPGKSCEAKITLIGSFNFDSPSVMLFHTVEVLEGVGGKPTNIQFTVNGFFTHETHNEAVNVGFEIDKRDIQIGTGTHIEAALPLEFLQDSMAMYSIDGAAEVVDIMSNVIAQKLDLEIDMFLENSYARNPQYEGVFNVRPSQGYAGSPKEWREQLKTVIDHMAISMKSNTYFYNGYFVIVGNPIDTMLIPNVNWTFNKITDDQNGVDVEYSIGAMSGSQRYTVVASDLIAPGRLKLFFVPTTNKYMTYKYYPYTFNVVHNYRNALTSNVPSVMMTKRHTIEEFTPLIGVINIEGNNGTIPQWGPSAPNNRWPE